MDAMGVGVINWSHDYELVIKERKVIKKMGTKALPTIKELSKNVFFSTGLVLALPFEPHVSYMALGLPQI